jgi:S-adenosylmethionine decarboxylase proenzyme
MEKLVSSIGVLEEYTFTGSHFVASYYMCDRSVLNNRELLRVYLKEAVIAAGATLLNLVDYQFEPSGVTLVALLSESHASIHTYPELGACFVDLFTCGTTCNYMRFHEYLSQALKAQSFNDFHFHRS